MAADFTPPSVRDQEASIAEEPHTEHAAGSWRERYPVHPCADCHPMMGADELNKLGEDIRAHGLHKRITLYNDPQSHKQVVLDGRNRLEALERIGIDLDHPPFPIFEETDVTDPASFVISLHIHRRHLTKAQQVDLIVAVVMAQHEKDPAKLARSFSPNAGRRGGSTKDPVLDAVKTVAAAHGISPRTAERAYAKRQGKPTAQRKPARPRP